LLDSDFKEGQTDILNALSFVPVTEREVINGVLNVQNTKNHCLAYLRYINNINVQNLKKASLFVDILNRSLDTEASKLLANLRDERLPAKIETTNLQRSYQLHPIHRNKSCKSTPSILKSSSYASPLPLPKLKQLPRCDYRLYEINYCEFRVAWDH
jgi:hypothetical protein